MYVIKNIIFISGLEGKETNNLKKAPINNISIPICKDALDIISKALFLRYL